ncbi:N-acetylmuramoyl-L-alanine amidase [Kitasatospora sp. NPDC052896]|uniref:peptidoglycan recognition protein family protein n=1 Tax=Kitasatospora sp. NPDC052896 TaxID=3364061 RepID=UPI0037C684A3
MRISLASFTSVASLLGAVLLPTTAAAIPVGTGPRIPRAAVARSTALPLTPLGPTARGAAPAPFGLRARGTPRYSLLGVSWDDPAAVWDGTVQVRTHRAEDGDGGSGGWSGWRPLAVEPEDRTDPGGAEPADGRHPRGATTPLWVGSSDGVEVRVAGRGPLPTGLRVDLVDPGADPAGGGPARDRVPPGRAPTSSHAAPRPAIVLRAGWGADETLRQPGVDYTDDVREVFVHHTDTGNDYRCADSPKVIRSIYQYHVVANGWRDIGYNFLVDRCGTVYEGRAGGVTLPVLGAHTLGFNSDSAGVAALGSYDSDAPSQRLLDGIARVAAWKLGLTGQDARGKAALVSASDRSRYPKGTSHTFAAISGHRDAFSTDCPGEALYRRLPDVRTAAAHLQGR